MEKLDRLKEVLSIPTYFDEESRMVEYLKKVLDDYFGDPDKRDPFGFNIHPSSIKAYEEYVCLRRSCYGNLYIDDY